MPLKVSDGMGAWISDFKKSDAPQFSGKSDKERREMAIAAYLDAKKGPKNEAHDNPPFDPDPPKKNMKKNSDGSATSPLSRAKQLAKMARDRGMKKEDVNEAVHPDHVTLHPHKTDKTKYTVGQVGKNVKGRLNPGEHISDSEVDDLHDMGMKVKHERRPYRESVEFDEAKDMYASAAKELKDYANKSGGIDKKDFHTAAKHIENIGRANIMNKGQHLGQLSKHLRDLDTSPREKVLSVLNKHGHNVGDFMPGAKMRRESIEEAGSPERYKMIKKAGDKYNKEKKKAERDAMKAMSKDKDMMGENNSAPQSAAHRRAQMGSRYSDIMKKRQADNEKARQALKDPDHNPSWANSKSKTEETVSELKKSTLGSYVNKASRDAASKAYGAASAAKDNRADQAGKDFSKSMKRLKGVETATKKMAKEDIDEAKSFDQKFRDHLKFSMSKSPAVQDYMKKRRADRDARHAKQDPAAVKKNYGPAVIPPGTAYNKARKKGMNPSAAADAVSTAFKNRAKGRKLPEGKIEEAAQFKVDIEGLPPTFIQGKSSAEILANLRKIVKQPSMIKNVERYTDMEVKKAYRQKAQGRPMGEAVDSTDTGGAEETKMAMKQIKAMRHFLDGIEQRVGNQGDMEEWYQNKLTKANDYLKSLYAYGKGDEEV